MGFLDLFHLHHWGEWKLDDTTRIYENSYGSRSELPTDIIKTYLSTCTSCGELGIKKIGLK